MLFLYFSSKASHGFPLKRNVFSFVCKTVITSWGLPHMLQVDLFFGRLGYIKFHDNVLFRRDCNTCVQHLGKQHVLCFMLFILFVIVLCFFVCLSVMCYLCVVLCFYVCYLFYCFFFYFFILCFYVFAAFCNRVRVQHLGKLTVEYISLSVLEFTRMCLLPKGSNTWVSTGRPAPGQTMITIYIYIYVYICSFCLLVFLIPGGRTF